MERELATMLLVWLRVLPLGLALATFTRQIVPLPIALSLTLALAAALLPAAGLATAPLSELSLLSFVRELSIGATFAIAVSLALHAAYWAVRLVGVPEPLAELRRMLSVPYALCAGYLVVSLRGPLVVVAGLSESLHDAPIGSPSYAGESFALGVAQLVGGALVTAIGFALPLLVSVWLATLTFALLGRALAPRALAPLPSGGALLFTLLAALLLVPLVARAPEAVREALASARALTRGFAK